MSEEKKSFWKTLGSWKSDRVVSFCAIFISLLSLATFIYQTNLMDKHSRLSVYPYLSVTTNFNPSAPRFSIILENLGVGPAVLESRIIKFKGKDYNNNLSDVLSVIRPELVELPEISYMAIGKGHVVPAGEENLIIGISGDTSHVLLFANEIDELTDQGLEYEIIYQAIYGERWQLTSSSNNPIKL